MMWAFKAIEWVMGFIMFVLYCCVAAASFLLACLFDSWSSRIIVVVGLIVWLTTLYGITEILVAIGPSDHRTAVCAVTTILYYMGSAVLLVAKVRGHR